MNNKKHIFAQDYSEIGQKNPKLEQNLNVINEMADGGNIPSSDKPILEVGKIYKLNDFIFSGEGQKLINDVYKIDYPNEDEFKVFSIENNPKTYRIERPSYRGSMPYTLFADDVKFNFNTLFDTSFDDNKLLEVGKTYNVNDFTFVGEAKDRIMDFEASYVDTDKFKVFSIKDNYYKIEKPSYQGVVYYWLKIDEVFSKYDLKDKVSMSTLEDLNLKPENKKTKKPKPEKVNIELATENFIQKNIIGENTFFTPKFVILEPLIELKELIKTSEVDFANELESVINDIDNYVTISEETDNNEIRNTSIIENNQPIKSKNKNKKTSGNKPKIDINEIMNRPDAPKELTEFVKNMTKSGGFKKIGF